MSNINKSIIRIKYIGIIIYVCTKIKDPEKRSPDNNIIERKELTGGKIKNNNILSTFRKDQTTPWFSS